jgi:hypothetical protein
LFWVAVFAIAMGYLESAVVVYIRKIYYPEGFDFPLKLLDHDVMITELFREISTVVMLAAAGIIAGRSRFERFGLFLYAFGWWDIFYYIFLRLLIGWPGSLLTPDILFLIPVTWIGPVMAPCINAATMIALGAIMCYFEGRKLNIRFTATEWMLLIAGSIILIIGYVEDYSSFMLQKFSFREFFFFGNKKEILDHATTYIPVRFNWFLFAAGQAVITVSVVKYLFRLRAGARQTIDRDLQPFS